MDTSALRKLSLTLKPLIEIAEVLEKIDGAEQQLGSIKGRTVAAQRDYDALVERMAREKNEADANIAIQLDKAKEQAETILKNAYDEADKLVHETTVNENARLAELRKKIEKAESESREWDSRIKKLMSSANTAESRLLEAEKSLAEVRAAYTSAGNILIGKKA